MWGQQSADASWRRCQRKRRAFRPVPRTCSCANLIDRENHAVGIGGKLTHARHHIRLAGEPTLRLTSPTTSMPVAARSSVPNGLLIRPPSAPRLATRNAVPERNVSHSHRPTTVTGARAKRRLQPQQMRNRIPLERGSSNCSLSAAITVHWRECRPDHRRQNPGSPAVRQNHYAARYAVTIGNAHPGPSWSRSMPASESGVSRRHERAVSIRVCWRWCR